MIVTFDSMKCADYLTKLSSIKLLVSKKTRFFFSRHWVTQTDSTVGIFTGFRKYKFRLRSAQSLCASDLSRREPDLQSIRRGFQAEWGVTTKWFAYVDLNLSNFTRCVILRLLSIRFASSLPTFIHAAAKHAGQPVSNLRVWQGGV